MFKPSTVNIARQVAESLTFNRTMLQPRYSHIPVAVMAEHYITPIDVTQQPLSSTRTDEVVRQIEEYNANPTGIADAEFDRLTEFMAHGLQSMLSFTRNNVVPMCKHITQAYTDHSQSARMPEINVEVFNYDPIHSEPGLTEHIMTYSDVRAGSQYRTFRMVMPTVEVMIDWMSTTPHMDGEVVRRWASALAPSEIQDVWISLWNSERMVAPEAVDFLKLTQQPFSVDKVLVAYFLSAYLCKNPQDIQGETGTLEEWNEASDRLHRLLGATLFNIYAQRARARRQERVVLRYDADDSVKTGRVLVRTNGDVYSEWGDKGGNVKVLLGAAVSAQGLMCAADLTRRADELVATWDRKHYLIRQTRVEKFVKERRNVLKTLFLYPAPEVKDLFDNQPTSPVVEARLSDELRRVRDADLDDIPRLVTRLVCNVYFPGTAYLEFLETMDRVATDMGNDVHNAREVATMAVVEMTAAWLVSQVKTTAVAFDVSRKVTAQTESEPHETDVPAEA